MLLGLFKESDRPGGSITTIHRWPHYGDHRMAPLRRSPPGPITPITKWLDCGDHGLALYHRSITISRKVRQVRRGYQKKTCKNGSFVLGILSFSVSSAFSSAAGERKNPLSHAKSAKYAEKSQKPKAEILAKGNLFGDFIFLCDLCVLERSGREKKTVVSRRARRVRRECQKKPAKTGLLP